MGDVMAYICSVLNFYSTVCMRIRRRKEDKQKLKRGNGCKNLDFTLIALLDLRVFIPIFTTLPQEEENNFMLIHKNVYNFLVGKKGQAKDCVKFENYLINQV